VLDTHLLPSAAESIVAKLSRLPEERIPFPTEFRCRDPAEFENVAPIDEYDYPAVQPALQRKRSSSSVSSSPPVVDSSLSARTDADGKSTDLGSEHESDDNGRVLMVAHGAAPAGKRRRLVLLSESMTSVHEAADSVSTASSMQAAAVARQLGVVSKQMEHHKQRFQRETTFSQPLWPQHHQHHQHPLAHHATYPAQTPAFYPNGSLAGSFAGGPAQMHHMLGNGSTGAAACGGKVSGAPTFAAGQAAAAAHMLSLYGRVRAEYVAATTSTSTSIAAPAASVAGTVAAGSAALPPFALPRTSAVGVSLRAGCPPNFMIASSSVAPRFLNLPTPTPAPTASPTIVTTTACNNGAAKGDDGGMTLLHMAAAIGSHSATSGAIATKTFLSDNAQQL
jgi:hypothetical protein